MNNAILVDTSWLNQAQCVPSPNWDWRPPDTLIDLLVIHSISLPPGEFGGPWIDALFQNNLDTNAHPYFAQLQGLKVSAHCLICRDGTLIQYVPLELRAWHAGQSSFQGRSRCNDFSIGIELEGTVTTAFTKQQYLTLIEVTGLIQELYPAITSERITGHSDIAPGRKLDPGPLFDWSTYLDALDT